MALIPLPALSLRRAPSPIDGSDPALPWLQVRDGRIQDPTGRPVLLRGFNVDAPAWATSPLPDVYLGKGRRSWGHGVSPAAVAAVTYFWLARDWQRDFATVWQAVARRFSDVPGVAAYDIINEPDGLPIPPVLFE